MHSFHRDTGNLMCEQLFNQANVSCIQNTQQKVKLFCKVEPFSLFYLLEASQSNHFVPSLRFFKNSLESKGTRTMDAERVHVSVPNPLRILDLSHLMVS